MVRRLTTFGAFGAMLFTSLWIAGCASEEPHALTGDTSIAHHPTLAERQQYTDQKGHYHLDLALRDHPDWEINQGGD